jgi:dCTP deaminase
MLLSDHSIRELMDVRTLIDPTPDDARIQPASVDLTLGEQVSWEENPGDWESYYHSGEWVIQPGEFVLAHTFERVCLPVDLAARVEGKSSLGRKGLLIHSTAGFIDPGFHGQITLELYNMGKYDIALTVRQSIAQICFMQLSTPALRPYGHPDLKSKYQNQQGAVEAR